MSLCKAVEALIKSKPSEGKTISLTLKDGCVTTQKLANEAVSTGKLEEGAVTQSKIAEGAVGEHELEDGSVTRDKIASSAVTAEKMANSSVTTDKVANGNIVEAKLKDGCVTTVKIKDKAVTSSKLADGSVSTGKLMDSAVTQSKLADGVVESNKLADESVSMNKLSAEVQNMLALLGFVAGNGYKFIGLATPDTVPDVANGNVFYIAATEGDYENFPSNAGIVDPDGEVIGAYPTLAYGEVALLAYNGYEALLDEVSPTLTEQGPPPSSGVVTGWIKETLPLLTKDATEAAIEAAIESVSTPCVSEGYYDSTKNIFRSVPQYDSSGADVWIDEVIMDPENPGTVIGTNYAYKMEDAHNRLYIDLSTNKAYRYNDTGYVQIVM